MKYIITDKHYTEKYKYNDYIILDDESGKRVYHIVKELNSNKYSLVDMSSGLIMYRFGGFDEMVDYLINCDAIKCYQTGIIEFVEE